MTTESYSATLGTIKKVYVVRGFQPRLDAAQGTITFLGRASDIRWRAVKATGIRRWERLLEVGCGTGRKCPCIQEQLGPTGKLVGFDYTQEMPSAAGQLVRRER